MYACHGIAGHEHAIILKQSLPQRANEISKGMFMLKESSRQLGLEAPCREKPWRSPGSNGIQANPPTLNVHVGECICMLSNGNGAPSLH